MHRFADWGRHDLPDTLCERTTPSIEWNAIYVWLLDANATRINDVIHSVLLNTKEFMETKRYSLRSVGKAGKIEKGRVRRLWEVLELREVSGAVDDLSPKLPGWVRVPGTPDFKTKREAEKALKRLQNQAEE